MKNSSQCSRDPFAPVLPTSGMSTLLHSNAWTPQIVLFFWPDTVVMATVCANLGIGFFLVDLHFWFHVVFCPRILYSNAIWWQYSPSLCSVWTGGYPFTLSLTNLKCSVGRYFFICIHFTPNSSHDLITVIKDSVLPILILHSSVIYSLFCFFSCCCPVCKHIPHVSPSVWKGVLFNTKASFSAI